NPSAPNLAAPNPSAPNLAAQGPCVPAPADHHDVLLRRLRELGELHRDGVLTDEEFARTKAVVLRGF
ncbi:SHOCT domain-containing protein, partial [Streptomyces sp. IBSBF 2806]|uniref:SHOCT domain-containing protein n=1 Tax=Streptomyces sp. IBSBF 2806 TaxID=2903529 RepID=UPI002FDC53E8